MLSLPAALRPPIAQGDSGNSQSGAVVNLMLDLDDSKDGLRVHGCSVNWGDGNELVEESWEIGQCFYRNWWWCLDSKVIEMANQRRKARGEGVLRIQE